MTTNSEQQPAADDYGRLINARYALGLFYLDNPARCYAALPLDLTEGNRRSIISARRDVADDGSYEIDLYCINGMACLGKDAPDFIAPEDDSRRVWLAFQPLAKRRSFYQSKRFAFYEKHLLTTDKRFTLLVRANGRSWNNSNWRRHI